MMNFRCCPYMLWCLLCFLPVCVFAADKQEFKTNLYGFTCPAEWEVVSGDWWYSTVGATEAQEYNPCHLYTRKLSEKEKGDGLVLPVASLVFNPYMQLGEYEGIEELEEAILQKIEEELIVGNGQYYSHSVALPSELGAEQIYPLVFVLTHEKDLLFNHCFAVTPYGTGHLAFPCREDGGCFECEETLIETLVSLRGLYDMLDRTLSVYQTDGWKISFPLYWEDVYVLTEEGEEDKEWRIESESRIRPATETVQFVSGQVFIQFMPLSFADLLSNPFVAATISTDQNLYYDLSTCFEELATSFTNNEESTYIRSRQMADRLILKGDYELQKDWLLITSNRAYRVWCYLSLTDTDNAVWDQYVEDIDRMLETLTDQSYSEEETWLALQAIKNHPVWHEELSEDVYPALSPELASPNYVLEKVSLTGKVTEEIYFCQKNQHFIIPYQDKAYETTSYPYTLQEEETTFRIFDTEGRQIGEQVTIGGYDPEDMLIYQYGIWAPVLLDEEAWDIYAEEHPAPDGLYYYVGYQFHSLHFGQDVRRWFAEPTNDYEGVAIYSWMTNYYEIPVGNEFLRLHYNDIIEGVFYWPTSAPFTIIPYPAACTGKEGPAFMSWTPTYNEQQEGEKCYWFFISSMKNQ